MWLFVTIIYFIKTNWNNDFYGDQFCYTITVSQNYSFLHNNRME